MPAIILPIKGITREKNDASYHGDSGMDIAVPVGTPVYSPCSGKILYSEWGHTPWGTSKNIGIDTPYSILIELASPFNFGGNTYYYCWLTHLSYVDHNVPDGQERPVRQGDYLGKTGKGNNNAHLHFGIIVNRGQGDERDWMSPEAMQKLLWDIQKGIGVGDIKTDLPPTVALQDRIIMKEFFHDGKLTIAWDGKLYEVLSIGSGIIELKREPIG